MSMPLKNYTADELAKMSRSRLNEAAFSRGIDVADETPTSDICKMILAHQQASPKQYARTVETESEPASEPAQSLAQTSSKLPKGDRVWFKLMAGSQPHEQADQYIALNGDNALVKRNQWMKLKRKHLKVLEEAIQSEFIRKDDKDDTLEERHIPRFNFQVREIEDGVPPERSRSIL